MKKQVNVAIEKLLRTKIDSKLDPRRNYTVEFDCDNYNIANLIQDIIYTLPYQITSEAILIRCSECYGELLSMHEVCEDCNKFFTKESEVA
tara:strand:+ start:245 stop:517 length:273 start_codon:yes stop_codon:yes gene_type:complete